MSAGEDAGDLRSCAGLAIYRNNSIKLPRVGSGRVACETVATDAATSASVFKFGEFRDHHAHGVLTVSVKRKESTR